jgi:hypothetical protein
MISSIQEYGRVIRRMGDHLHRSQHHKAGKGRVTLPADLFHTLNQPIWTGS